jgi:hypothetical protein
MKDEEQRMKKKIEDNSSLAAAVAIPQAQLINGKAQILRHLGTGKPFSP